LSCHSADFGGQSLGVYRDIFGIELAALHSVDLFAFR
jgi:hypothetical protein